MQACGLHCRLIAVTLYLSHPTDLLWNPLKKQNPALHFPSPWNSMGTQVKDTCSFEISKSKVQEQAHKKVSPQFLFIGSEALTAYTWKKKSRERGKICPAIFTGWLEVLSVEKLFLLLWHLFLHPSQKTNYSFRSDLWYIELRVPLSAESAISDHALHGWSCYASIYSSSSRKCFPSTSLLP